MAPLIHSTFATKESEPETPPEEKAFPKLPTHRPRRVSVAQRLTSMLPSDYVETRLDAESRNVLDNLMPSSASEDEASSSDADRSTSGTPSFEPRSPIPRIEWENVATTSPAINRG